MTLSSPAERARGAAVSAVLMAGLLWALVAGLAIRLGPSPAERRGAAIDLTLPRPAPPPAVHQPVRRERARQREGEASPSNLKATATEVVAPPPPVPLPPPPLPAAPVANTGFQSTQGAAPVAGPGTGAGGQGNGFGAGGEGDGPGGGGEGRNTPPRRIGGRIRPGDLPDELAYNLAAGVDLVVGVRYAVEEDGRVTDCRITRSSGDRRLDVLTCELIEQRFRYRPALDDDRRPFKSWIVENHVWNFEDVRERRR